MKIIRRLVNYWRFSDDLYRLQEDATRYSRQAEIYLAMALPEKALEFYAKSSDCALEVDRILEQRLLRSKN